ncbi:response regulator transcription factor [Desulfosporosinus sp. SB140]|uniref:response regulator transcription factor n=1 Tax=Desulfosporosinus paludis TaxID=3115649 RepID=UPI00388D25A8
MIRILIAEPLTLLREGITAIFQQEEDIEVVGSCKNWLEAIRLSRVTAFDLLLIGTSVYSLEMYRQIKRKQPKVKILLFSSDSLKTINVNNIINDVIVLPNNIDSTMLLTSIRISSYWGSTSLQHHYLPVSTCMEKSSCYGLEIEEALILFLLTQGASNYSISKYMFLSERAVKNRLTTIYKKLSVKNRTRAVIKAIKENLIPG